ncbi:MAG: PQQ-like beta-propeller repeat protein [Candidatus Hinthialibacter antarcticus]|nr:PQQ-like beta-propeller repeat protein [Candidatus Hinthialibacter antarcticus]
MRTLKQMLILTAVGVFAVGMVQAADWPQYHGPNRDRISSETGWVNQWDGDGPEIQWRARLGPGYTSFTVVDGKTYVAGYDKAKGEDNIFCFDAKTGDEIWKHAYKCELIDNLHEGGPAATPTIYDGKVFTISKEGHFNCLDAKTGKVVWTKDLKSELGVKTPTWGFAGAPLVVDDIIYVDVGVIAAYKLDGGDPVWKTKNYGEAYASPVLFPFNGKSYLVAFPKLGMVIVDLKAGQEFSTYAWDTNYGINAATPIVDGNKVFIASGYNMGGVMIEVEKDGTAKKLWASKDMRNQMNAAVLYKGYLYGFDESQLKCLDAKTGELKWKDGGLGKGSLMLADGKLVVLGGKGELVIAEASPEGLNPTGRKQILGGTCWSCPVLSNGMLYARNARGDMVALDMKAS